MITNFEDLTEGLTEFEQKEFLPRVIDSLANCIGKDKAKTSNQIIDELATYGHKLSPSRFRKIISYIRISGQMPCLMATSYGYYVSNNIKELEGYIDSLNDRIDAISFMRDQIKHQLQELKNLPLQASLFQ